MRAIRQLIRKLSFWIVTSWVVFLLVASAFAWTKRERDFDSFAWKNDVGLRPFMIRDLLSDRELVGMFRQDVDGLLGVPHGRDSTRKGNYIYWAGYTGIDDMWLEIDFRNDVVTEMRVVPD